MKNPFNFAFAVVLIGMFVSGPDQTALGQDKTPQSITWTGTTNTILALHTPHPLGAVSSSGLPVTLKVVSGPAVFAGGNLIVNAPGTVWVTAAQAGNEAYASAHESRSLNVRHARLTPVGGLATGDIPRRIEVSGGLALVAAQHAGLVVVDISDVVNPKLVGTWHGIAGEDVQDVKVRGNRAYVSVIPDLGGPGRLRVLDLADPAHPRQIGQWDTPAFDFDVVGALAYLITEQGLQGVDFSNPAAPVGLFGPIGCVGGHVIRAVGQIAYVAHTGGVAIWDLGGDAQPRILSECPSGGWAYPTDVEVIGTRLLLSSGFFLLGERFFRGLAAIDLEEHTSWSLPVGEGAFDVDVSDGYAIVATRGGARVIDTTGPELLEIGGDDGSAWVHAAKIVGNHAMVGGWAHTLGTDGLSVMNMSWGYPQTLEWLLPAGVPFQNRPLGRPVKSSSGLPVTLSVISGPATVANDELVLTGLGVITVRVSQAGNDEYLPVVAEKSLIVLPPQIGVRQAPAGVEVIWPAGLAGLVLQERPGLGPNTSWSEVKNPRVQLGDQVVVELEPTGQSRFFRLMAP